MGKTIRHRYLGLMGAVILLGYLFFSMGDATAVSDGTTTGDGRIRVEEGQGFTRIVFPCDRPEAASVEPDLAKARFLVRLPGGGAKITLPRLGAGHTLVKGVTILPDSEREVLVQVILTSGLVDWISYRYERPPRAVLYLRPRSGSNRSEDGSSGFSVSQKQEKATAKKREATLEDRDKSFAPTEKSADLVKTSPVEKRTSGTEGSRSGIKKDTSRVERGDKDGEDLWYLSAADIPEFVRLGTAYPPDFRDMKADQRRLYLQALEKFGDRDFSGAKEIASKIVPKDSLSWLAETLAFFTVDCDFRIAEEEGDKEYTEAIQGYREAMNRFPESKFVPDAVLMMATAYRRMEFFQEAIVQYQVFLTKFPENPGASQALFWKGECLFQRGRYDEAKALFGEFVKRRPLSIHGRIAGLRVGDCLYKMGDLRAARHQYGIVLSESSALSYYPVDSLFMAGRSFLETGDFQKGREILFKAVNLDPGNKEALAMLDHIARSYLDENREDEALKVNLFLLESFGSDGSQMADIGLRRRAGDYVNTAGVYQDVTDPYANLAEEVIYQESPVSVQSGDVDRAVAMSRQILSKREQDPLKQRSLSLLAYCLNSLIHRHHGQNDHLEVIRPYNENRDLILSDNNRDKGILLLVGESFQSLGLLEDALTVYQHAKAAGDVAEDHVLFQIQRVLALKGDRKAARKAFEDFQREFAGSLYLPQVQKLLGDFCLDMGDYPAAIKWYRLALSGDRSGADMGIVFAHLGQALKESGRDKEAIEAYQEAIDRMWPFRDQTWAKKVLGESLTALAVYHDDGGRVSRAVECYQKIVHLSPSEDQVNWALYRIEVSHREMGNAEMMRQAFEDLNKRSTDSLWTKLATWTAGDLVFEDTAEPYLTGVRQALVKEKKK